MKETQLRVVVDGENHIFGDREVVSIGRHVDSALRLDNPRVSRLHALALCSDGSWTLSDEGSRNGTFTAGQRISSISLGEAITINVGGDKGPVLEVTVEVAEARSHGSTATQSPMIADFTRQVDPALTHQTTPVGTTRIGRADDNDVVIDDLLVSRYHAELRGLKAGGFELEDLGSHNGTYVNGRRIERTVQVADADLITIGHHLFRLHDGEIVAHVDEGSVAFGAESISVLTRDGTTLLTDVSLALEERGFLAVVGPSGSGKSTLLRALSGLRPADSGNVSYAGRDLYAEYDELRQRIGFVPQDDVVHSQLTVREVLDASAALRFPPDTSPEERDVRVKEVLDELGLDRRAGVIVAALSGGQRKRVSVAIELLTRPSLLFLDEPTSGLDPGTERSVMELLRELADTGRTVIVVTHSVESLHLCDRVLVLAVGGRLAYFGPPQLAPSYFGRSDMQGVFQRLNREVDRDWGSRFAAHPDRVRFMPRFDQAPGAPQALPKAPAGSRLRQLRTLLVRDLKILVKDRRTVITALAQGPLLGLVLMAALEVDSLDVDGGPQISQAAVSLLLLVLAASLIGVSNGIRAIVSESGIYQRERRAGLSSGAYLTSKVIVLGTLTVLQSAGMTALAVTNQGGPSDALVLDDGRVELILVMSGAGLSALALALGLSALARSSDQAVALLPVVVVVLLILALPDVHKTPVASQASYAASSQWAMRAGGATADLNRLELLTNLAADLDSADQETFEDLGLLYVAPDSPAVTELARKRGDARFAHDRSTWITAMIGLGATALVSLLIASVALRRKRLV